MIAKCIKLIAISQQTGQNIHNLISIPLYKTIPHCELSVDVCEKFALINVRPLCNSSATTSMGGL